MRYLVAFLILIIPVNAFSAYFCGSLQNGYYSNGVSYYQPTTTIESFATGWSAPCSPYVEYYNSGGCKLNVQTGMTNVFFAKYNCNYYAGLANTPDTDGDGVRDPLDNCPGTAPGGNVDSSGCPTEPATCQNNTMDNGETGVDCGGSCDASTCTAYCPTGYNYEAEIDMCLKETPPDKFGNCPNQFAIHVPGDPAAQCQHFVAPEYASTNDQPDQSVFGTLPSGWSGGSYVIATNVQPSTTVDNGNGTSTTTTTTTVTSGSGTGASSTTVTRVLTTNNTTGAVVSDQTTSTQATAPEEETGNYNFDVTDTASDGDLPTGIVPEQQNFGSFLNDAVSSNAGSSIISGSGIQTSAPVCSISAPVFGSDFTLDFCNQQITDFLELLGTFLVGFAYLIALFIVFA